MNLDINLSTKFFSSITFVMEEGYIGKGGSNDGKAKAIRESKKHA